MSLRLAPTGLMVAAFVMASAATLPATRAEGVRPLDTALKNEIKTSIDEGLRFLRWRVDRDGTWDGDRVVTALATRAFAESHRRYVEEDGPFIRNPIAWLKREAPWQISADGAMPISEPIRATQAALTVIVLERSQNPEHKPAIKDGIGYITRWVEDVSRGRASTDLATASYVIDALRAVALPRNDRIWRLVIEAVSQSHAGQRGSNGNAAPPDDPDANCLALYCLISAGVEPFDVRVQQVRKSIESAESVTETANANRPGLYRSLIARVRAMSAHVGAEHSVGGPWTSWRTDIAQTLISLQQADGSWAGVEVEANRNLATSLAVLALEPIYNEGS